MKIAYFVENYGVQSETFVNDLITYFSKKKCEVYLIINSCKNSSNNLENVKVIETNFSNRFGKILFVFYLICKVFGILKFYYNVKIKIANLSIKPVLSKLKPDVIYVDFGNNAALLHHVFEELKIPYVVHFHGQDASSLLYFRPYLDQLILIFQNSKKIITASNHIKNRLILSGCEEDKVSIVSLGVDTKNIKNVVKGTKKTKYPSIIHVGRLVDKKSPITILYAFKKIREKFDNAIFTIIGSGPLEKEIIECISYLNLKDSVKMLNQLDSYSVWQHLAQSWIYTQHCSTGKDGDQEGFSVSMLEAAYCKLPVVSTIHDGIPENVIDGVTGFLEKEHDYIAFYNRIDQLISDKELRLVFGQNGKKNVLDNYKIKDRGSNIYNILVK